MLDQWKIFHLKYGNLELDILPGIGGRLWDVRYFGRSLLFQNSELTGKKVEPSDLSEMPTRSPQFNFPLWGGEKTWTAPDSCWINDAPFPVLDSGRYQIHSCDNRHISLASQQCPVSGLMIKRHIELVTKNKWTLEHVVTNIGTDPRSTGIWSVRQQQ